MYMYMYYVYVYMRHFTYRLLLTMHMHAARNLAQEPKFLITTSMTDSAMTVMLTLQVNI